MNHILDGDTMEPMDGDSSSADLRRWIQMTSMDGDAAIEDSSMDGDYTEEDMEGFTDESMDEPGSTVLMIWRQQDDS